MKNNKKTRKTKVEKRRLAFEKRNVKKEMNLARYGAEGGSALVMAKTGEFNRRFVAAFMALVFVISLMTVGIGVVTKADPSSTVLMSKTNSLFDAVTCNVQFGDILLEDFTVELPAGSVEANIQDVQDAVDAKANISATFQKAIVKKADGSQTLVSSVGVYNDETFYSVNGNNEDTGIRLKKEDGEQLVLVYSVEYPVTYSIDGTEGKEGATGRIDGQNTVKYGYPLDFSVHPYKNLETSPATIYAIQNGSYTIAGSASKTIVFDEKNNATIPGNIVVGPVNVDITFSQPSKFTIYGSSVTQGHICAEDSYSEGYGREQENAANIQGDWTNKDATYDYHKDFGVSSGKNAYIVLYSQTPKSGGIFSEGQQYFLNMIKINGEEIYVPTSYTTGAISEETVLENGSVVRVECLNSSIRDSRTGNKIRSKYLITISNVQEDIYFSTYFRLGGEQKMYLKGLRGINYTAAAHQTTLFRRSLPPYYDNYPNKGFNYFYTLDLTDENTPNDAERMHVYDAYYTTTLYDQFGTSESILQNLGSILNTNKIDHNTFPCKNVYLYKVKEGYNPATVELGTPLYNYGSLNTGSEQAIPLKRSTLEADSINSEFPSQFGIALGTATNNTTHSDFYQWNRRIGDNSSAAKTYGGYGKWFVVIGALRDHSYDGDETAFAFSEVSLIDLNVASPANYNNMGKYSEIYGDDAQDSSNETKYPAFYSGLRSHKYHYGFYLEEHEGENQSITVNALPYQYAVEYDLNGGTISHGSDAAIFSGNSDVFFEKDNTQSDSHARHNIEDSATITLPLSEPTKEDTTSGTVTTSYSFLNWTVVDQNGNEHGTYMPGQRFVIDKTTAGYDSSSSQGDWTYGYAKEDKEVDDDYLKFHFVAKWKETKSTDLRQYQVLGLKETPNASVNAIWDETAKCFKSLDGNTTIAPSTDTEGNVTDTIVISKTYQETDGTLAGKSFTKTYTLYYYDGSNKATVNDNVISFNDHDPSTSQQLYIGNNELSTIEIEELAEGDTISYFYDLNTHEVTIKEDTLGDSPDISQAFTIHPSLCDETGQPIDNSVTQTVYFVDSLGKEGSVVFVGGLLNGVTGNSSLIVSRDGSTHLQLKDDEYVTFLDLYENYKLSISEDSVDGYETSFKEDAAQATSTYVNQAISSDKTVTVQNEKVFRDATFEILLKDGESPYTDENYQFSVDISLTGEGIIEKRESLNSENNNIQFEIKNDTLVGTLKIENGDGESTRKKTIKVPDGVTMLVSHSDYFYNNLSISEDAEGQNRYPDTGKVINAPITIYITDSVNGDVGAGVYDDGNGSHAVLYTLAGLTVIMGGAGAAYGYRKKDEFVE